MTGRRDEVDRWWARVLGVPAAAIRAGGVFPPSRFDRVGIVAVAGAAAPLVYGPADTRPALHAVLARARSRSQRGDHRVIYAVQQPSGPVTRPAES